MKNLNVLNNLKFIWKYISNEKKFNFLIIIFLTIIVSFFEVLSIGSVIPFISVLSNPESIYNNESFHTLIILLDISGPNELILPITLIFIFLTIISGFLRFYLLYFQTKVTYSTGVDLSVKIFKKSINQPYYVHISRNSSDLISAISNKSNELIVSLIYPFIIFISSSIILSFVVLIIISIDPLLVISSIILISLIYFLIYNRTRKIISVSSSNISFNYSNVVKIIQESLGSIRDIILDSSHELFIKEYSKSESKLRSSRANIQIISGSPRFVVETLGIVMIASFSYYLSTYKDNFLDFIPLLGVIALTAQRMIPIIQQIFSSITAIRGGEASVKDAINLLNQKVYTDNKDGKISKFRFLKSIEFKNVYFKYTPKQKYILKNINFKIKKGSIIGIVGKTGSGKSTLLDLIMGLIYPSKGEIIVDDNKLERNNLKSWQENISHVPQNIFLRDTDITNNIAFNKTINKDKIIEVSKSSQIFDFINTLQKKFKTYVGEKGVKLSGGQIQRIGVARALYKNTPILILDEATSALDNETEKKLMENIYNVSEKKTTFMVAHRKSSLSNCNIIFKVIDGKLIKHL